MARTHPFFRHVTPATGLAAPVPTPERYPYHDNDQCPEGQQIKKSGEWQYYAGHLGEERERCAQCAALDQAAA